MRKGREQRNQEAIYHALFDGSRDGILITDARGTILDVNDSFSGITSYSREESLGKNPRMLKSGHHDAAFYAALWRDLLEQGFWSGEVWNHRKSGELYAESLTITNVQDNNGAVSNYIAVFSDITPSKLHEQQLERIAHFDALTSIPNRFLLADRMKQAIAHAKRENKLLAVCYLDLDGFKEVNDTLGHEAGDALLIETAKRIVHTIRMQDTVARLGGDEFVILLGDLERLEECVNAMERLMEQLERTFIIQEQRAEVSASIGIALFPTDAEDPDMLLRHADHAMYVAKQTGKNNYKFYDSLQDRKTRDHQAALQRIRQGLAAGEFERFYQPKVSLVSGLPVGAEALIRWNHPQDGLGSQQEPTEANRVNSLLYRGCAVPRKCIWCAVRPPVAYFPVAVYRA